MDQLSLPPGAWPLIADDVLARLRRADLVLWLRGADPGVLAHLDSAQTLCELTPDTPRPSQLAAASTPFLIQAPQVPRPAWLPGQGPSSPQPLLPALGSPKVLLTRRQPLNHKLGQSLARAGIASLPLPTLEFGPAPDPSRLTQYLATLDRYFGVIVSSPQGAACLGKAPKLPAQLRVAAVGASTARALQAHGLPCHLIPDAPHSEGLVHALKEKGWIAKSWLHLRGNKGRDLLSHEIQAAQGSYDLVCGYQTILPTLSRPLLRAALDPQLQVVSFASGQSYDNFKTLLDPLLAPQSVAMHLARLKVISFGPVTSQRLRQDGIEIHQQLAQPDVLAQQDAIMACLTNPQDGPDQAP